jgi:hypothetical protein
MQPHEEFGTRLHGTRCCYSNISIIYLLFLNLRLYTCAEFDYILKQFNPIHFIQSLYLIVRLILILRSYINLVFEVDLPLNLKS